MSALTKPRLQCPSAVGTVAADEIKRKLKWSGRRVKPSVLVSGPPLNAHDGDLVLYRDLAMVPKRSEAEKEAAEKARRERIEKARRARMRFQKDDAG